MDNQGIILGKFCHALNIVGLTSEKYVVYSHVVQVFVPWLFFPISSVYKKNDSILFNVYVEFLCVCVCVPLAL